MWQKTSRAQERARAKRKGSYPTKKQQEFSTTPIYIYIYIYIYRCIGKEKRGPSNSGKMEVTLYLYIGWDNPSQVHRTK